MANYKRFIATAFLTGVFQVLGGTYASAGIVMEVMVSPEVLRSPVSGRVVVYLIRDGSNLPDHAEPSEGPFFSDPQPMFGKDVRDLKPGEMFVIEDDCSFFPDPPSLLLPGKYKARAVFDRSRAGWKVESRRRQLVF